MVKDMEGNVKQFESLLESVAEYGATSYELVKLRTINKTAGVVSSLIPHAVVFLILMVFLLFLNLGVGFWLGKVIGNIFYGFFAVAAFYGIIGLGIHFFMHDQIKKKVCDYIIKQTLN